MKTSLSLTNAKKLEKQYNDSVFRALALIDRLLISLNESTLNELYFLPIMDHAHEFPEEYEDAENINYPDYTFDYDLYPFTSLDTNKFDELINSVKSIPRAGELMEDVFKLLFPPVETIFDLGSDAILPRQVDKAHALMKKVREMIVQYIEDKYPDAEIV